MRTIHDDDAGSAAALAAGRIGFARIGRDSRLVAASARFVALLAGEGVEQDELIGRVHPDDREPLRVAIDRAFDAAESLDLVVRVRLPEQRLRFVQLLAQGAPEPPLAVVALDVTRLAWDAHAAREAERTKDEFLHVLSHELRSPLNALLGWTRILAIKRAGDPEVAGVVPRLERGARTVLKLANDLLDLCRMTRGKLKIEPHPMRLTDAVAAAIATARTAAADKNVTIDASLPAGGMDMKGDSDRLQQLVASLLSNAVRFSEGGAVVHVDLCQEGSAAVLTVRDSGAGIAADKLSHLFDRFRPMSAAVPTERPDSSSAHDRNGLGLGLPLARDVAELHGGTIAAQSAGAGCGSTFTVRLPLDRDYGPQPPASGI